MAFGGPMPGGPAPAPPGGAMPAPPPPKPAQPDPEIVRIAESPTWDDVIAVLRSDKMRNYRIDIETDATVMEDANADKAARTEFMKVAGELLAQAYQAMTVAPQFLPVVKEMFMFTVRGFHAGRSLEETFEDAFDEMARQFKDNPPVPPGQEKASIQQDPNGDVKIQLEAEKVKQDGIAKAADNKVAEAKVASEAQAKQAQQGIDLKRHNDTMALDVQRHQDEVALKSRELALREREHGLAVAQHNRQLVTEAVQPQASPDGSVPTPGPVAGPLEGLMAQLGQMVQVLAQGQQQNQQQMTALIQMMAAPKRVLRGPDGRAVGVEPVLQ